MKRSTFIKLFSSALVVPDAVLRRSAAAQHEGATSEASPHAGMDHDGMDMSGTGAAYLTIKNDGAESDWLTGGKTEQAEVVEIHEIVDTGGVMEMRPLADGLEIPAGSEVVLDPGGYHIMLIGLTEDLTLDLTFELTLTFKNAGDVTAPVTVRRTAPEGNEIQTVQSGDLTIAGVWSRPAPSFKDVMGTPVASPTV